MMRYTCYLYMVVLLCGSQVHADDPYSLIMKGKLTEASESLANSLTATTRDENIIFAQSLIERDGVKAARLMRTALDGTVAPQYHEVIYLRLAQYYFVAQDYSRLDKLVGEYRSHWKNGAYARDMARLLSAACEQRKDYGASQKELSRYCALSPKGEEAQWGEIDKARLAGSREKGVGNTKALKKISQQSSGTCVAPSLYALAIGAIAEGKTDDAILHVNVMREECPAAVGLDALEERLGAASADKGGDTHANKVTGSFYSVKVGVFLSIGNAKEFAKRFAAFKEPVETEGKAISGKSYQVVYVGRFGSFDEARKLKARLEQAAAGSSYQVVAR